MNDFFEAMGRSHVALNRTIESLGVPYSDPFNEEAAIFDVNDPADMGRVKVITKDDLVSDWIPVNGSSRGRLSAKYIGATVMVAKTNGRSEDMYVVGILSNSPTVGVVGTPIQIPIIDESLGLWSGSSDPGLRCNKTNEGRTYVLSNEMNQDLVICLRRTSPQTGSAPAWAWKSLTNGLWVEKGINPGNAGDLRVTQGQGENPGIPECTESLLGEMHEYTEDRGFRTTLMRCQRDENKSYSWVPASAIPTYFRSALPNCTEKLHGMKALADDGNNSEEVTCQRYQGQMAWVRQGKRKPHKFFDAGGAITRDQFLGGYGPIPELKREGEDAASGFDWVSGDKAIVEGVFDQLFRDLPLTGTDPNLRSALQVAGLLPAQAFDNADTLSRIARASVEAKTGVPVSELTQVIRQSLDSGQQIDSATAKLLEGVGQAGDILVNGVQAGSESAALVQIGQSTLQAALISLDPKTASVMTGLMSGGIIGAIDTAVILQLNSLPPEVNKYVQPILEISKSLLGGYPSTLSNLILTASGGGLLSAVTSTINAAVGSNIVTPQLLSTVATGLFTGDFGSVPQLFASVGGLSVIPKLPPELGSLPLLATSLLGLFGQQQSLSQLFGAAGLGLTALNTLLGGNFNSAVSILAGISALAGIFSTVAGLSACPCGPKCRKTSHGKDSDGNNLLARCGSMSANNANAYSPTGTPIPNNTGPIALDQKSIFTLLGSNLIPPNIFNLTSSITTLPRVGQMASRFYDSRHADETEFMLELTHTVEAIEKTFKIADNNITRIESIERKLIDALFNLINNVICKKKGKGGGLSLMTELIRDVRENSQAIRDLYQFTRSLDRRKKGGPAGVRPTTNIVRSIANISSLVKLSARGCKEATKLLNSAVIPAHLEWLTMEPGTDFSSVLGDYGPDVPVPFPDERTIFNSERVLAESISSKVGGNDPQASDSLSRVLTPGLVEELRSVDASGNPLTGETDPFTDGTIPLERGESLYDRIVGRTGQKDCE